MKTQIFQKTQMLQYIKGIVNDDYAMDVLYYCIRKNVSSNEFTLKDVASIKLSEKFFDTPIQININKEYSNKLETLALLLSIRALMINKPLIKYCNNNKLLFEEMHPCNKEFGWIEYSTVISDCIKDDDFRNIFTMMESSYYEDKIDCEDKELFITMTKSPERRNLLNYYKKVAQNKNWVHDEVLHDNLFVCDNTIKEYTIHQNIAYVGNTAFSFCPNLTTIIIERKDLLFGLFPIIECNKLSKIIVPFGSEEYYKETLPYYKNIIFSKEDLDRIKNIEKYPILQNHEKSKNYSGTC